MARRKDTPSPEPDPAKAFIVKALTNWRTADTAESGGAGSLRFEGTLDLKFLNLQQWDENDERDRIAENKPALVIDQIGEPYRQLVGQQRQAKPSIQINPVDSGADVDTAEVFQGVIRHIEITGGAKAARDEAFKGAVGPGWGYYRIITEYEYDQAAVKPGPDGTLPAGLFDQCIKYQPIENQFTVFRDPSCPIHEPWKARFCLIVEDVPVDTFKVKYPDAKATSQEAFQSTGLMMPEWFPEGSVRVADYFYVEEKEGPEVALLSDGRVVPLLSAPIGVAILQRRKPMIRTVKLAKITGAEILEGNDDKTEGRIWPGSYIPVIPMYGEAITVDGKRTLRGIVRAARDPQRMYNYQNSELVYELALAPKSKVIMAEGQQEGYEEMWKQAPVKAFPALLYKPTSIGGERVPEPKVAQFTDPAKIQSIVVAINQHKADLRSTLSFYDPSDPSRKNADQSGRAILARQQAMDAGSINFRDNFGQALRYEGMVLLDLIPKIYNRPGRVLRIVGIEDPGDHDTVTVGQPWKRKQLTAAQRGVQGIFAWGAGRYDVTVDIGVGEQTRRQEAAASQIELMKVLPPEMAAAMAPGAVRNMDWPGARETADRLDRTLPPHIRSDGDEQDDPEMLKGKLQQSEQQRQEAMSVIQQLQQAVKTDAVKQQATIAKAKIDMAQAIQLQRMKDATTITVAKINALTKGVVMANEAEVEALALAHEAEQAELDRQHQADLSQADQEHQQFMADHGHAQNMQLAQQDAALNPPPPAGA